MQTRFGACCNKSSPASGQWCPCGDDAYSDDDEVHLDDYIHGAISDDHILHENETIIQMRSASDDEDDESDEKMQWIRENSNQCDTTRPMHHTVSSN
jgi:hypothetical protein